MNTAKSKSAIIYGLGDNGIKACHYLAKRYHIIGCSDTDPNKKKGEIGSRFRFYEPLELVDLEVDYILVTSIYGEEIFHFLVNEIGIDRNKILLRDEWCKLLFLTSYGDKNPDKIFYVMSKEIRKKNGLLSLVFSVLEQLSFVEEKGYIPVVDLQSFSNQYLELDKIGKENAWEYYFEPLSSYPLEEVYCSKNVVLGYDDPCYLNEYQTKYDMKRMSELYRKYIHVCDSVVRKIEKEYNKRIGNDTNV
ncbi:MAG: hypothetical protein ACI4UK_01545, partial [Floccifex sp.]